MASPQLDCTNYGGSRNYELEYKVRGLLYRERGVGCQVCQEFISGRHTNDAEWAIAHHVKPLSRGGSYHPRNIILLCRQHHKAVHRYLKRKGACR